jgi:hypothetical protein
MFFTLIKPLPLAITFATLFGVLIHDTQMDKAAITAIVVPSAVIAGIGFADAALKLNDQHVHTEKVHVFDTLKTAQPRMQTRFNEDKKYLSSKRQSTNATDSNYIWPSV